MKRSRGYEERERIRRLQERVRAGNLPYFDPLADGRPLEFERALARHYGGFQARALRERERASNRERRAEREGGRERARSREGGREGERTCPHEPRASKRSPPSVSARSRGV